jgi:hypothetical protein
MLNLLLIRETSVSCHDFATDDKAHLDLMRGDFGYINIYPGCDCGGTVPEKLLKYTF